MPLTEEELREWEANEHEFTVAWGLEAPTDMLRLIEDRREARGLLEDAPEWYSGEDVHYAWWQRVKAYLSPPQPEAQEVGSGGVLESPWGEHGLRKDEPL